jgi:DNA-binding transcriptional ArsR family regulator
MMKQSELPSCNIGEHAGKAPTLTSLETLARAAEIFRAAGDLPRLRLLDLLRSGEQCVTELIAATGIKPSTLSQQLKLLRMEDLIVSRRSGRHLFYSLADRHISDLLDNVLAHAEGDCPSSTHATNSNHPMKENS